MSLVRTLARDGRWNHDHHWDWLERRNHAGLGWLWRAIFGEGFR